LLRVLTPVDHQIIMDMNAANIGGVQRFTINNVTYLPQNVPTLYTTLTVGDEYASNPTVYGQVNPYVVKYGEVIEIIVNGYLENLHPFHLHGHQFQVIWRTPANRVELTELPSPNTMKLGRPVGSAQRKQQLQAPAHLTPLSIAA
jgi:FtsP/CotA-like multicopper oxidase with cupredoxin domain